jgi:molecular chaperone DnaJ
MRPEWLETDYYAVLGVPKDAPDKDVKKAYRKLAQQFHPDKNPGDPVAEERFKQASEAYAVVGDPDLRKEYDHAREMGQFVSTPGGGQRYVRVEDLFGEGGGTVFDLFGGGMGDLFGRGPAAGRPVVRPGRDQTAELGLTFHEAIGGVTKELSIGGARVKVKIPKGIEDGARVRVRGKGEPGINGGPNGDLFVTVRVGNHPLFGRKGANLLLTVPVTFIEAALGATIGVPTLAGDPVRLRIPPGTPHGKTFRVTGRGVETSTGTGDLLVTVEVVVPTELSDDEKAKLAELAALASGPDPRAYLGVS